MHLLKKAIALATILVLSVSCVAPVTANFAPPAPAPPDVIQDAALYIPRIANSEVSMGHGCPVTDHLMISARHVLAKDLPDGSFQLDKGMWDDMKGNVGFVEAIRYDEFRDLAIGYSAHPFAKTFTYATDPLALGDTVYTINFDYDRQEGIVYPNFVIASTYKGPFVGYLLLGESAGFGASGSCVFNSKGEIVGIYIRFDPNTKQGWAVDLRNPETRFKVDERMVP